MNKISLFLLCGMFLIGVCGCSNNDINIVGKKFVRTSKASDEEMYSYVHEKIIKKYCLPKAEVLNKSANDFCDPLRTSAKYSSQLSNLKQLFIDLGISYDELLSIEQNTYSEAIKNEENIYTDSFAFENNNIITYEFETNMVDYMENFSFEGTYSKTDNNTYTYKLNNWHNSFASGIIVVNKNNIVVNGNEYVLQ